MSFESRIEEKIQELKSYAEKNDNIIWYDRVLDILYDKDDLVTEQVIEDAVGELEAAGVRVVRKADEDYADADEGVNDFIPADVNISQRSLNVYNLMERLENDEIDMMPEFQRHRDLWTMEQQSRLIESLVLKIPIPTFYFNAANDDKWIVIDGLQRLSAFFNFLVGQKNEDGERIREKFCGLQYMKDFNGKTFDDLPRQYIRRIKETQIVAYAVEKGTPDGIVYNIFQRINTGGVKLEPQEIRHALYGGKATALLQRLAESEAFLQVTQHSIPSERMQDREYANRFIAITELDYLKDYEGSMDDFLRKALKKVNQYEEKDLLRVEENFYRAMKASRDIFDKYAFRKYYSHMSRRGPINKAIFETWSLILSELSQEQIDILVRKKEQVFVAFRKKIEDDEFNLALKGGDSYALKRRIEIVRELVKEIL